MTLGKNFRNLKLLGKPYLKTMDYFNQDNLERKNSILVCEERLELSKFFIWLNEQIKLGNHQFILGQLENISDKPKNNSQRKLIFLLDELLEQFSNYTGISALSIQLALKQALSISYRYTIERNNQIIEVTPCLYPLDYSSIQNRVY